MIASSLKESEGDPVVDIMLRKEADVNIKSNTGQVYLPLLPYVDLQPFY